MQYHLHSYAINFTVLQRLLEYCDKLKDELGFSPQIIVTDHVDNLDLDGKTTFDSLVNGNRFRNRGFIKE